MMGNLSFVFFNQLDPIAFRLGSWPVYWYGLLIGLGMVTGYFLYTFEIKRKGMDAEKAFDLMFWSIIIGFVGARIYYVAFSWEQYSENILDVLAIWNGGIAIYGGIIAGAFTLIYLCRKYEYPIPLMTDMVAPALMAAQAIGRWGNFMNQEAFGGVVERSFLERMYLPEFVIQQMYIAGQYRHPTFLYESVWNLLGLIFLLVLRRKRHFLLEGDITLLYVIWYGVGRAYIEGMRTDSLYLGPFRVSQVLSLFLVASAVIIFIYRRKTNTKIRKYTDSDQLIKMKG
ncbi:prolipoprotein diacylglyceryl transferase [Facklamia lactis]|nr:prolipoprotein diacylglyceryl transferase [Facklamia lactis]